MHWIILCEIRGTASFAPACGLVLPNWLESTPTEARAERPPQLSLTCAGSSQWLTATGTENISPSFYSASIPIVVKSDIWLQIRLLAVLHTVMALFYSESVIQHLPLLLVAAARDARHSFGFCYLSRWRPADNRPTAHKQRRGSNSIVKIGFDYPAI